MASNAFENVPFYSGDTSVKNFLQSFELEAVKKDWVEDKKCKVIGLCVTSVAKQAFESLSDEDKKDFAKISKNLKDTCSKAKDLWIRDFQERILKPNESPANFALDLEHIITRAYPEMSSADRLVTLKNQFLIRLPAHVRVVVRGGMCNMDWPNLVKLADEVFVDYCSSTGDLVGMDTKVEVEGELNRMRVLPKRKENRRFDGNCYYCGKRGHKESNCFQKNRSNQKTDRRSSYQNNRYSVNKPDSLKQTKNEASAYHVQVRNTDNDPDNDLSFFND